MSTTLTAGSPPAARRAPGFWIIAPVVAMAAFMEVLDLSIANVSLLHIAGSLSATPDQATWILTAYTVTNAIILPLSGWLATTFGRKRYFMASIGCFSVASFLCGLAPTLGLLILFRAIQGLVGGGLQPNAQAILSDAAPPEKRGMAFAIYGIAVIFAPAIGPTLGGWITDHMSWRWVFLINVPVGLLLLPFVKALITDPPHMVAAQARRRERRDRLDYLGFSLIAVGLGSLQVVLDRGQQDNWFASHLIVAMTAVTLLTLASFVYWEWHREDPIVDLKLLKNPTFAAANFLMFMLGFILLATTVLLPLFVQSLMGYTAEEAGLLLSPGGLTIMLLMPLVGRLVSRVDVRFLISGGLVVVAVALFMLTRVDTQSGFFTLMWIRVIQGCGLAFLFVPINTAAFGVLPPEKSSNGSALINMARNIGGSVGISFVVTMAQRWQQFHQNLLVAHVRASSPELQAYLGRVRAYFAHRPGFPHAPRGQAYGYLYQTIIRQAGMLAYIDDFALLGLVTLAMIPFVFFLKSGRLAKGAHVLLE